MATREIKWTLRALKDKMAIYEYWIYKNKSISYPQKLDRLFNEVMTLTISFPYSGIETEFKNVRIRIVKHFKLVYRITDSVIEVLTVWDSRQHPKKFKIK
jgi:toxin YoeB